MRIEGVGGKLHQPALRLFLVWAVLAVVGTIVLLAPDGDASAIVNGVLRIGLVLAGVAGACIETEELEFLIRR